jgi:predicted O-methyltransferase YrrM
MLNPKDPDSMLALGRSYWECRVLLTGAELDLFTLLAGEPLTAAEVTQRIGGDERATRTVLDALAAMELITKRNGRYRCEPDVAAHLASDSPVSIQPMLMHMAGLWHSWGELSGFVLGDDEAIARANVRRGDAYLKAFIGAMHVVSRPQAALIAQAVNPGTAKSLLDIGAGPGTYTLAFLEQSPTLHATVFDRAPVIEMARQRAAEAGMLDRVTFVGGDFYADELPGGHDFALLSAIIHQNSRAQNIDLFRKALHALKPGGRLVLRDHVMSPDRTQPRRGALFAINMLVRTEGGGTYTFDEIREDLQQAGFERVRQLQPDGGMDGLVEGFRTTGST